MSFVNTLVLVDRMGSSLSDIASMEDVNYYHGHNVLFFKKEWNVFDIGSPVFHNTATADIIF